MSAIYDAMSILIELPILSAIPAAIFLFLYFRRKRRTVLITAILWLLYALYEGSIRLGLICAEECNIRVDLLLFYPILLLMSVIALVLFFRAGKESDGREKESETG